MTIHKTKDAVKRHLREQLAKAANAYALELHNMWDIEATAAYWIGGEEEPCAATTSATSTKTAPTYAGSSGR